MPDVASPILAAPRLFTITLPDPLVICPGHPQPSHTTRSP